jgi:ABC-2 type transport system permease protein
VRIALLIAVKDLRQRLRDRSALLVAVIAPLGLALIFSQLLGGVTDFHARYVVADLDGGQLAQVLRTDVIGSLVKAGVADVDTVPTEADARGAVDGSVKIGAYAGKPVSAAFVIPAGFTAAIQAGRPTTLAIYGARDSGLGTEIARSLAQRFGDGVVTVQLSVATTATLRGALPDAAAQARLVQAASSAVPPVRLVDVQASLRQLSLPTYFSASMAILFLFFSAQIGMVSLFEERRQGTLARILAGPVRPRTVLLGKVLGGFVMGVVAMGVLVVATTLLIRADWGPPVGVAALVLAAVVAGLGISALVTSFTRTVEAAGSASSAVAITLGMLGGTFSPTAQAPELLSTLSLATPHGWFLRGLGDLHGAGSTVADCVPAVGVLLAMGLVTGAIGMLRARRLLTAR